jgi:hypothetical protein
MGKFLFSGLLIALALYLLAIELNVTEVLDWVHSSLGLI